MATEYQLSYTAAEIDEKLGIIDGLSDRIDNISNLPTSVEIQSRTYQNDWSEAVAVSNLYGFYSTDFLLAEPLENALIVGLKFKYNDTDYFLSDLIQEGLVTHTACEHLHFNAVYNDDYSMYLTAQIVSPSLAEGLIEINTDNISEFTLYYIPTDSESDETIESHTHENKETLDKLSEDESGNLLFNGEQISSFDVYEWAKQPEKPTYTAEEVGALSSDTVIPTIVQTAGESESLVMSQKAVTDLVNQALSGTDETYETVDSVEEMTDTSKSYILSTTGTIWEYGTVEIETETEEIITEQIVGTEDNPYETGRLSSGAANGTSGYVTTPYIDLTKYSEAFELHLEGIPFLHTDNANIRYSMYNTDKTHIITQLTNSSAFRTDIPTATFTGNTGDESVCIGLTPPVAYKNGTVVGYVRFSGEGDESSANVYITYTQKNISTETTEGWVDTGLIVSDITTFSLENPSVKSFMDLADYDDEDYSYTNVVDYAGSDYYRKDLPLPIVLTWDKDFNSVEYTVSINTLSGVLNTGMQTYYTDDNKIVIPNLIPNKTYYYKVYGIRANSTTELLKEGDFVTSNGTRMLNIDGIQNVRDIGGYVGADSLNVKYGMIYRGSAMDEAISSILCITDKGKQEMVRRVGIKTDLDLRSSKTESALGSGIDFLCVAYDNYATAITNTTQQGYFKTILEYIVTQLTDNKPVYIHCQGGCDRTGTIIFLLLGLLGVSESDLAKEYELSSFSSIGKKTRIRNSTTYNYSGMVEAIKTYEGDTITDKFVAFATACGIAEDTITSFRSLMLA